MDDPNHSKREHKPSYFSMKQSILLAGFLVLAGALSAQKFGYCNAQALLIEIPEVKSADSELQAYQTMLTKKGQERVKTWQEQYQALEKKKADGAISPKDYETQAATLQAEQESIAKYEQEVYEQLAKKRETLFKPLLEKVNKAMADVAKENGLMYVFDAGSSFLLYADESQDVTKLVKTKLGIAN